VTSLNIRFGSKADMLTSPRHVRFTPDSRHSSVKVECLKSARTWKSGASISDGGEGPKRGHKDPRKTALMKSR
jgi:hypothetical protein